MHTSKPIAVSQKSATSNLSSLLQALLISIRILDTSGYIYTRINMKYMIMVNLDNIL